jgi:hypothetical protein
MKYPTSPGRTWAAYTLAFRTIGLPWKNSPMALKRRDSPQTPGPEQEEWQRPLFIKFMDIFRFVHVKEIIFHNFRKPLPAIGKIFT